MAKRVRKEERKRASLGHFDHDEFLDLVGKRIKKIRKEKGFTSAEHFAYDIDISRVGMSRYEAGAFDDIRFKTLLKIIDGLEISPKEFFLEILNSIEYKKTINKK